MWFFYFFFFFKQKTAYEMRISDWSSDVCSSDLLADARIDFGNRGIHLGAVRSEPVSCIVDRLDIKCGERRADIGGAAHPVADRVDALHIADIAVVAQPVGREIGRASRTERVCQYA